MPRYGDVGIIVERAVGSGRSADKAGTRATKRPLTWGGEHTMHIQMMYLRCIPEIYIILSTNVTPIYLI